MLLQQFSNEKRTRGGGGGGGLVAPPPSRILQKCVFMHGSVFRLSSLLPIYSLPFIKPQSGNQRT